MAWEGHNHAKINDFLNKLKGCQKVVEVQSEVNKQMKTAKKRKEQNRIGNKVNGSSGGNNENK